MLLLVRLRSLSRLVAAELGRIREQEHNLFNKNDLHEKEQEQLGQVEKRLAGMGWKED